MDTAPDFSVFCLALRWPRRKEDADALRRAMATGPDWTALADGWRRHRVAPLLLAALGGCGATQVPAAAMAEVRRQALAAASLSLRQVAELARLAAAFAQADVAVLAFKGVALSAQLFGDYALREARDIDLLVDPKDIVRAEMVLAQAGYRRVGAPLTPRQRAAWMHRIKDIQYVHDATGVAVELHHRLTDNPHLLACEFAALWNEREEVRLGEVVVATLPRRHLALYLCAHGASHGWERLRWLIDLAAALRAPGSVDAAIAAAAAAGLGAAMLHAVMLAHDWLGLAVAEQHLRGARSSREVARLDRILSPLYVGSAWHEMPSRGSWRGLVRASLWQRLYRLSLKSDWRYRASQASREWFTPVDWDTLRLPDALFFLYPLLRPVGWLARRWQR